MNFKLIPNKIESFIIRFLKTLDRLPLLILIDNSSYIDYCEQN